jgi:hypothetical protein
MRKGIGLENTILALLRVSKKREENIAIAVKCRQCQAIKAKYNEKTKMRRYRHGLSR